MIRIDRAAVRQIWDVLGRLIPRRTRGPDPAVGFVADPGGLKVWARHGDCTAEFEKEGNFGSGTFRLRPDAAFVGLGKTTGDLTLDHDGDRIVARWHDGVVPQTSVLELRTEAPEPRIAEPTRWESASAEWAVAIAEARRACSGEFVRFALNRICLRGRKGEIAATDGRQLLRWSGFRFPWTEDLLVPPMLAFEAAELRSIAEWKIGRTEEHVVFRGGAWRLAAAIDREGRFPDVDRVIPGRDRFVTRLSLDPDDARFLHRTLPRLPGNTQPSRPVTLDLNGHVRIRALDQQPATELTLSRSSCTGTAQQLVCCGDYLRRTVELGFREIQLADPETPMVAQDRRRTFLFLPLTGSTPVPRDGAVLIESAASPLPERTTPMTVRPSPEPAEPTNSPEPVDGPLGIAIALREQFRDGCRKANELVQAIRQQRRQTRLVETTLASLRELQVGR